MTHPRPVLAVIALAVAMALSALGATGQVRIKPGANVPPIQTTPTVPQTGILTLTCCVAGIDKNAAADLDTFPAKIYGMELSNDSNKSMDVWLDGATTTISRAPFDLRWPNGTQVWWVRGAASGDPDCATATYSDVAAIRVASDLAGNNICVRTKRGKVALLHVDAIVFDRIPSWPEGDNQTVRVTLHYTLGR